MSVARRLLAVLVTTLAAGCGAPQPAEWTQLNGYRWRPLNVDGEAPGFTPLSARRTGVEFQNHVSDSLLLTNRNLGQGAGVAIGDVDGDGRADVFLAKTEGCSALYRNLGDWKFEDVSFSPSEVLV